MTTIISQPATNSINAAYRPILIKVNIDLVMPVVFCDIYFNDIYYKTVSSTLQALELQFDLQTAAQEFLGKYIAPNGSSLLHDVPDPIVSCYCKIRGSHYDSGGLIVVDTVVPIQATGGTAAVAGTGLQSNTFTILNATLQHEDNQDLATHLTTFQTGTWAGNAWPLSHRANGYKVAGSDFFPIVYTGVKKMKCLKLTVQLKDGTVASYTNCSFYPDCPLVTNIIIDETDLGNGTQAIVIHWDTPTGPFYKIKIGYRPQGSSDPYTYIYQTAHFHSKSLILPLGLQQIEISAIGGLVQCDPQPPDVFDNEGIAAPACVVPNITGSPLLPNAFVGVAYSYSFAVTGTNPFTLTSVVKPSWMTITPTGGDIVFSGTPPAGSDGTGIAVSFTINNGCGTDDFADVIDVIATNCVSITMYPLAPGSVVVHYTDCSGVHQDTPVPSPTTICTNGGGYSVTGGGVGIISTTPGVC